nr:protein delta homolog 2-like [Pogona vitticeps]
MTVPSILSSQLCSADQSGGERLRHVGMQGRAVVWGQLRGEESCQRQCHNGGTCQVEDGKPRCSCRAGYTGAECETELSPCRSAPCLHGGQCQETENQTFACSCLPGRSGNRCEVSVDLCSLNPCPQGTACVSGEGSFICSCLEGALCQQPQGSCLDGVCQGGATAPLLYVALPLTLLLFLAVPAVTLLALRLRHRSRQTPPGPPEPAANNSFQPDAVHLIRNINHSDLERGLGEDGVAPKTGLRPPRGLPKTDISNEERAKLNRLNTVPASPGPLL